MYRKSLYFEMEHRCVCVSVSTCVCVGGGGVEPPVIAPCPPAPPTSGSPQYYPSHPQPLGPSYVFHFLTKETLC